MTLKPLTDSDGKPVQLADILAEINRPEVLDISALGVELQVKAVRARVPHYLQQRLSACNTACWINAGLTDADREAIVNGEAGENPRFVEFLKLLEADADARAVRREIAAAAIVEANFTADPITAQLLENMGPLGDEVAEAVTNFIRRAVSFSPPGSSPSDGETPPDSMAETKRRRLTK